MSVCTLEVKHGAMPNHPERRLLENPGCLASFGLNGMVRSAAVAALTHRLRHFKISLTIFQELPQSSPFERVLSRYNHPYGGILMILSGEAVSRKPFYARRTLDSSGDVLALFSY